MQSVITDGQYPSVRVSYDPFTDGFWPVRNPSEKFVYRRIYVVIDGSRPSVISIFFVVSGLPARSVLRARLTHSILRDCLARSILRVRLASSVLWADLASSGQVIGPP